MDFLFFILLNAVLLIRPEDLLPDVAGARLYMIVICLCLLRSGSQILAHLQPAALAERPLTACVLGLWVTGILSHLVRGQFGLAADFAGEFGKVMLYYMLLIAVIDTPERLHRFLGYIVAFVITLTTLALLQYEGVIDVEALRPLERVQSHDEDDRDVILQLRGSGIFNDPNDLCLILVTGTLCALYRAIVAPNSIARVMWVLPIGLFGYAVMLTQSRGGLLGLMAAAFTWGYGYFGWRKTLALAVIAVPAIFVLGSGRQTDFSLGKEDTLNSRVLAWAEGLGLLASNPITGIGPYEYGGYVGVVAHNSFVHSYAELGLLGGSLFLGAFALAALGLHRSRPHPTSRLAWLRPLILAIVIGYAGGIFSLSRNYVPPTYLILGLADAYLRAAFPDPPTWLRVNWGLIGWGVAGGVAGLIGLKLLTQVFLALGG